MSEWDALGPLEAHLWRRLARAAREASDPWRLVALATAGPGGPAARTVALRAADRAAGTVEIHTDARTPKVAALHADPRAEVLLWDDGTQEQLRLSVTIAVIEADPERWADVPEPARTNYGTTPAPGTPVAAPDGYRRDADRSRFAALVGRVVAIDAVCLAADPHRRAAWRDGTWRWVAP